MPEMMSAQIASNINGAQQAGQSSPPAGPDKASQGDVDKFNDAMSGNSQQDAQASQQAGQVQDPGQSQNISQTQDAGQVQDVGQAQNSQMSKTPGESILEKLGNVGQKMQDENQNLVASLNKENLTPEDLIRLNIKAAQVMMDQTILGKGGEKGEQSIQTLMKGQ